MVVDFIRTRQLHHLAQVHHGDAIGNMAHHQQIVGNEQVGQIQLILQVVKHIDDLRLNGHVQRRYRFIANDELRVHRERAGNADALALTAGKFVRIARSVLGIQPDVAQQLQNALLAFLFIGAQVMHIQRFAHDV